MAYFDEKPSSENFHWGNAAMGSDGPEVVCSERSNPAPTALPSDRGLHVCPPSAQNAPEYAPQLLERSSPLYSEGEPETPSPGIGVRTDSTDATISPSNEPLSVSTDQGPEKPRGETLIFGLRRKTFWVAGILLLIVIAGAAIGGSVGGVYAKRNQSTSSASTTASSATSTSTSTSTSTQPPSPATTSSPPSRNKFTLQVWSQPAFAGESQTYLDPGSFQTAFFARSYIWNVGEYDEDLTLSYCSAVFCNGTVEIGWRGSSNRKNVGEPLNQTWGFDHVVIDCRSSFMEPACPTPEELSTVSRVPVSVTSTSSVPVANATLAGGSATETGTGSVTGTGTETGEFSSATSPATTLTTVTRLRL